MTGGVRGRRSDRPVVVAVPPVAFGPPADIWYFAMEIRSDTWHSNGRDMGELGLSSDEPVGSREGPTCPRKEFRDQRPDALSLGRRDAAGMECFAESRCARREQMGLVPCALCLVRGLRCC